MSENVEPTNDSTRRFLRLWDLSTELFFTLIFWAFALVGYIVFGGLLMIPIVTKVEVIIFLILVPTVLFVITLAIALNRNRIIERIADKKGLSLLYKLENFVVAIFLALFITILVYSISEPMGIIIIQPWVRISISGILMFFYIPYTFFLNPLTKTGKIIVYIGYIRESINNLEARNRWVKKSLENIVTYLRDQGIKVPFGTLYYEFNLKGIKNEKINSLLENLESWFRNNNTQPSLYEILNEIPDNNQIEISSIEEKEISLRGKVKQLSIDTKVKLVIAFIPIIVIVIEKLVNYFF